MDTDSIVTDLPYAKTNSIEFLKDLDRYATEKPFFCNIPILNVPGARQHNISTYAQPGVAVYDIRGREKFFTLNRNGFELKKSLAVPPESANLLEDDWVQQNYYRSVKQFLLDELKAETVLVYDHVVSTRRNFACQC